MIGLLRAAVQPRDYRGNVRCEGYRLEDHMVCPRCDGDGVEPVKADPTNQCGNFIGTDTPVCRICGGYGDVPK